MNRDKSPKATIVPIKRDDSPSPTSYKDVDHTWKKTSLHRTTMNYTIKKDAKRSFIEEMQKAKKTLPQCGHYKADDIKKFNMLSHGTNIPRYK